MTLVSTREFDFEQGQEYVRSVAESREYAEGEQGDEYTPIVVGLAWLLQSANCRGFQFKRCEAGGDPQCPIPRLIEDEEKKLGTDWVRPSRLV